MGFDEHPHIAKYDVAGEVQFGLRMGSKDIIFCPDERELGMALSNAMLSVPNTSDKMLSASLDIDQAVA
jgi:hypothetical protein